MRTRYYRELIEFDSYFDRYDYLVLGGTVGRSTFGFDRHLNQDFYRSREWRNVRDEVIVRDDGCDLGVPGYEIHSEILVHHMNPISVEDILHGEDWIVNPEFLITTTHKTHNAIHYGMEAPKPIFEKRLPGDTKLW